VGVELHAFNRKVKCSLLELHERVQSLLLFIQQTLGCFGSVNADVYWCYCFQPWANAKMTLCVQ